MTKSLQISIGEVSCNDYLYILLSGFFYFVYLYFFFLFCNYRPPKRKLLTNKKNNEKRRKIEEDLDEPVDTGLSLMEDEELALKMLDA